MAEIEVTKACSRDFLTVAVAPHQVYGPRDPLFLPNFLAAAESGKLRVFGSGENRISVCYVDNYCHGLILGYEALYRTSPALGKYYVCTDGGNVNLWTFLDEAIVSQGLPSIRSKMHLPVWLLFAVAWVLGIVGRIMGTKFRLSRFNVIMLTIDRWFDITNAQRDLGYQPIVPHKEAWATTLEWFRARPDWWRAKAAGSLTKANRKTM